jgi:hypothetical protein
MTAVALTGVPLIATALLATAAAITATALLWSRFGRWRLLSRTAGVLLCELLVVLSVGLVVNQREQFYPSWQALAGDTGTNTMTAQRPPGRLDARLAHDPAAVRAATTLTWQPTGAAQWRLAGPPDVVVPAGYSGRTSATYPALIELGGGVAARHAAGADPGVVAVVAVPSRRTTAAALGSLPVALAQDVRVTRRGWALVVAAAQTPLAARLAEAEPDRFAALVVVGGSALPAGVRSDPALAVAVVRSTAGSPLLPGVAALTATPKQAWTVATEWAVRQAPQALAAPLVLPTAVP